MSDLRSFEGATKAQMTYAMMSTVKTFGNTSLLMPPTGLQAEKKPIKGEKSYEHMVRQAMLKKQVGRNKFRWSAGGKVVRVQERERRLRSDRKMFCCFIALLVPVLIFFIVLLVILLKSSSGGYADAEQQSPATKLPQVVGYNWATETLHA